MSFLNPVNEPVLRFSSTDADAPQINYNSRTAGDIKAVIKACLVTGYGDKASAGWSIVNEVDHVAEFISPSVDMSDYRFGINDTSASSTTWYYQYQNVRTNPEYNTPTKSFSQIDKSHTDNGWQLLVTQKGIMLIELVQSVAVNKLSARLTYIGQVKSAVNNLGVNMSFFNVGHNGPVSTPAIFFYNSAYTHINVSGMSSKYGYFGPLLASGDSYDSVLGVSTMDITSPLYIRDSGRVLVGEQPALLVMQVNNESDLYGIVETTRAARQVLQITLGTNYAQPDVMYRRGCVVQIYLDHWSY